MSGAYHILLFSLLAVSLASCPDPSTEPVSGNAPTEADTTSSATPEIISTDTVTEQKPAEITKDAGKEESTENNETSQERPKDRPRPLQPYVIIANPPPIEGRLTSMQIQSASVENGILSITFSYGGGCKSHLFELFSTGEQTEDGLIQVFLTDAITDDHCKKLITETQKFDIKRLKDPARSELRIRINDHKPPVRWEYGRK